MNTKNLALLAIPLALTACSGRSDAEKVVRAAMKDPDSAKFGVFYYNSQTGKACLTTNAKNSMGGYTGDKQVRLTKDGDGWHYGSEEEEDADECRKSYADVVEKAFPNLTPEQLSAEADRLHDEADNVRN